MFSWKSQFSRCLWEDRVGIEPVVHSTARMVRCTVQGQCCNVMPARARTLVGDVASRLSHECGILSLSLSLSPLLSLSRCPLKTSEDWNSLRRFIIYTNRRGQQEFTQLFVWSKLVRVLLLRFPIQHLYKTLVIIAPQYKNETREEGSLVTLLLATIFSFADVSPNLGVIGIG